MHTKWLYSRHLATLLVYYLLERNYIVVLSLDFVGNVDESLTDLLGLRMVAPKEYRNGWFGTVK